MVSTSVRLCNFSARFFGYYRRRDNFEEKQSGGIGKIYCFDSAAVVVGGLVTLKFYEAGVDVDSKRIH